MTNWNDWDEAQQRRGQFTAWLVRAWDWAGDHNMPGVANDLADLISHAEEPDYPLWQQAKERGLLLGQGKIALQLAEMCGIPPAGQHGDSWEREINYAPVIYLEEAMWRQIHGQLGWVNRSHDLKLGRCFFLWSPAGNIVRFVMRTSKDIGHE